MKQSKFIPSVDSEALNRGLNYKTPTPKPSYSMQRISDTLVRQSAKASTILPSIMTKDNLQSSARKIPNSY